MSKTATYTDEDGKKIQEILQEIKDYVVSNYFPRLGKSDAIMVKFGDMGQYPGERLTEHKYSFSFDSFYKRICFGIGKDCYYFDPPTGTAFGSSLFDNWSQAIDLLEYWPQVKKLIEAEFDNRAFKPKELKQNLYTFAV